MEERLLAITKKFRPALETMSAERRLGGIGDVIVLLYSAPLALVGIIWLIRVTDVSVFQEDPLLLLIFAILMTVLGLLNFFLIIELGTNQYGSIDGSLSGIVFWSAILLIGPSAVWLGVIWTLYELASAWRISTSSATRWNAVRNFCLNLTGNSLLPLISLSQYQRWGGEFPLAGRTLSAILPAIGAIAINSGLWLLLWAGYFIYTMWALKKMGREINVRFAIAFFILGFGLNHLAHPFAILATEIYVRNGLPYYLFFMAGMLMVAYLARRLSQAAESSRQQSRQLEKLEQLGRAIINAPPDEVTLPAILEEHVPNMFPAGNLVLWTFPDRILFKHPKIWTPDLHLIWPWLLKQTDAQFFSAEDSLPWNEASTAHNPILAAPIREIETDQVFGGFYLELHTLAEPWDRRLLTNLAPAVQSLTSQVASAIHQSVVYAQSLELQRVTQELKWAGSIQSSLLPYSFPNIPGWQLALTLKPAGETSGDFFDVIPLGNEKIGLVIADVLDKGIGPALYMAISRTLIRTYAIELDSQPDTVFFATNERILSDTNSNLFVTAFYGILDPESGELTYCNAGHNPPYLVSSNNSEGIQELGRNAIPIGITKDATWGNNTITLLPGDALILYTDGIPEAQNESGELFGEKSLLDVIRANQGKSAGDLQASILDAVHKFVEDAPQYDDITIMVLVRDV